MSTSPTDFLNNTRDLVTNFFRNNPSNKFQITLVFKVIKVGPSGEVVDEEETGRSSKQEAIYSATNVEEAYERMKTKILESFAAYMRNGRGWRLKEAVKLTITKSTLNALRGSSHIPLPDKIKNTKAITNIKNNDDMCFKWAVTRALNPVTRKYRQNIVTIELKEQSKKYNWDGIEFPTPCTERQFKKFEKNNDVSILVFGHVVEHQQTKIIPLYAPKDRRETTVRLFFQRSEDGQNSHYCVITNMSRLVSSQLSNKKAKK